MTHLRNIARAAAALGLAALIAAPALSDEPGPGGARAVPPKSGEEVYRAVCQACHMADARGGTGAATIPALAGNSRLAASAYPIMLVTRGRGAMPGMADALTATQIAGVVTYVRTHFGNDYAEPVTEAEVKQMMPQPAGGAH